MKALVSCCSALIVMLSVTLPAYTQGGAPHLLRRQITIENMQFFPEVLFLAVVQDVNSGNVIDVYVFPMNGRPLMRHYPDALIDFYWLQRRDQPALCNTRAALSACFSRLGNAILRLPVFRRFENIRESTDIWLPPADPRAVERTDYAVTVNRRSGLNLYVARRSFSFNDGRPLRIRTYRKPFIPY